MMATSMRKLILTLLAPAILVIFAAGTEIDKAEKAWAAAVMARDFAALDKIYSDDLIYAHSTGIIETKKQYLDKLKTGDQKYDSLTFESLKVVPHGNAAIGHAIMRMKGATKGVPFDNHIMMMHTWVKHGGAWKLVAHQTTRLP